jgi:hypothetical protein
LNALPEIRTSLTRETPAFFDANPELKEAYRKPVKNLPAEQQERAMTTIAARVLHTVMPRKQSAGAKVSTRSANAKPSIMAVGAGQMAE